MNPSIVTNLRFNISYVLHDASITQKREHVNCKFYGKKKNVAKYNKNFIKEELHRIRKENILNKCDRTEKECHILTQKGNVMIKKKGTFVLRQLMEDFILIPCGKTAETVNQVLTLSETAAFIYERAESAKTAEQLVRLVSREYQVDEEDVREDVEEILETLKTAGILEETEEKA